MRDILGVLKFVQGAVSKKDLVPAMKHFVIEDGVVRSFNGVIALSAPIDFDMNTAPLAAPLIKAIDNCHDVVNLSMTKANRLRIESGNFKAFIDCIELADLPHQVPEGEPVEFLGDIFMDALKALVPFVGNDASRPWSNGILLRGQSAFVTNNVCLVEYWLGVDIPFVVNIPMMAIKEMVRIKEPPTGMRLTENSVTFDYPDGRWIRSQLYDTTWPEFAAVLEVECEATPVPEGLFEGLQAVKPFLEKDGRVYFNDDRILTHTDEELGAVYRVPGLHPEGIYNLQMLSLLAPVATHIDFTRYPAHSMFYGDRLRGAIIGQSA